MTAIDGPLRRFAPPPRAEIPADALYGRLLASAAQHLLGTGPEPRARLRLADGRLEPLPLDRWLAPADATDIEVLERVEAPVLDLGCGPGRHLAALRRAGKRGLGVDLSPVAVRLARGRGAPTRSTARCGHRSRAPGRGGRSCCWTATSASAARRSCCSGAPASCSRRAARSSSRPIRRARRRTRVKVRLEAPGVVSEWFRWARVGRGRRRRGGGARGVRGRGRPRARGPHLRNAQTPVRTLSRMLPAPPGPFRPGFFRSPLRGPWLTSALGSILLVLITIVATTGFLSHAAYMPDLRGQRDRPGRPRPAVRPSSTGRPARPGCTRSTRACTRTSGWSRSRSCWRSCGRSSRGCSRCRRSPARRRRSSGSRSRCWSRARSSSWPRAC